MEFSPPAIGTRVSVAVRALAIVGLASLLALAVAGIVRMSGSSKTPFEFLATLFTLNRERLSVRADPERLASGESLELSWTHEGAPGDGIYEMRYPCRPEVRLTSPAGDEILCDVDVTLGRGAALALVPVSQAGAPQTIEVTIQFRPNGSEAASIVASTMILVNPPPSGEVPPPSPPAAERTTPPPPATLTPGTRTIRQYTISTTSPRILPGGVPDLRIEIVDRGVLTDAGEFVATSSVNRSEQAAVVFDVTNVGAAVSQPWDFSANLPVASDGLFKSPTQQPLAPGDRIRFTIGFRNIRQEGENTVVFTIDPQNSLRDKDRSNDSATTTITRRD